MITRQDMQLYMRDLLYSAEDAEEALRAAGLPDKDRAFLEKNIMRKKQLIRKMLALYGGN